MKSNPEYAAINTCGKEGVGVDIYDQDTNTFTSVHSMNVFSATYSDYQKVAANDADPDNYSLKKSTANKISMLQRCAELIQANVSQTNSAFNITKAYTMVEVNATVSIRTTFFDIPVTSGVDANGNPTYDLDFSNIGSGRQEIKYIGILGY